LSVALPVQVIAPALPATPLIVNTTSSPGGLLPISG
jgi:hypothetical protein